MASNFQKYIQYFKDKYPHADEKEIIMGEMIFKETFFSNVSNERQSYSHVARLFVHHGFLVMLSKARFIISIDKIRNWEGDTANAKTV